MTFTVAMVLRSGGCFNNLWAERLSEQVEKHIQPERICILTDMTWAKDRGRTTPLIHNWPGWWSKAELFRPGVFDGPVLYLDLDTLVCGPIPNLESLQWGRLHMLSDFYKPHRPASGVMAWTPSPETEAIYNDFKANADALIAAKKYTATDPRTGAFGDGGFIGRFPHERLQKALPDVFTSFKMNGVAANGPGKFPVVCMHGQPRLHELANNHWARKHWEGK